MGLVNLDYSDLIMNRELLLLGLLRQADMHGYKLIEFIERDLSLCTNLKKPTAYFLLDKLAQKGWILWTEEREGNRPPRRIYQITPEGEKQFQRLLREALRQVEPVKFSDDIPLAFAGDMPREELLELLAGRRAGLQEALEAVQRTPPHPGLFQLLIDHQRVHLQSELHWLDEVMERIRSKLSTDGADEHK
jgi:DNA-binding PadR family transcriptional regulator